MVIWSYISHSNSYKVVIKTLFLCEKMALWKDTDYESQVTALQITLTFKNRIIRENI